MRFKTLALIAPLAIFAACSSKSSNVTGNDTTSTKPPNPPPNAVTVTISDFMFTPQTVTVAKGGVVTWVNQGPSTHAVVADTTAGMHFNSGQIVGGNAATGATPGRFSVTFTTTGTFPYKDPGHPGMTGSVVVQ